VSMCVCVCERERGRVGNRRKRGWWRDETEGTPGPGCCDMT